MKKNNGVISSTGLLVRPLFVSAGVLVLWYAFFYPYWNVGKGDETSITNGLIPGLVTFHAILAAMVIAKVWDEYKTIKKCIRDDDCQAFQECLHDRIPGVVHLLLGSISAFLIFQTMIVKYENFWAGVDVIGTTTFVLALYWEAATTLDNPARAPWYRGEIPDEWWPKKKGDSKKPTTRAA